MSTRRKLRSISAIQYRQWQGASLCIDNWGVLGEDEIMVFERGTSMRCLEGFHFRLVAARFEGLSFINHSMTKHTIVKRQQNSTTIGTNLTKAVFILFNQLRLDTEQKLNTSLKSTLQGRHIIRKLSTQHIVECTEVSTEITPSFLTKPLVQRKARLVISLDRLP
jgi:hypothetical protein